MSYPRVTKLPDEVKRERAVQAIKKFVSIHRRTPEYKEMGKRGSGVPSFRYLKRLFGSGKAALLAAGCELRPYGFALHKFNPKPKGSIWVSNKPRKEKRTPKRFIVGPDFKRLRSRMQAEYALWEVEQRNSVGVFILDREDRKVV